MNNTNRKNSILLSAKDNFLNFHMQALLLECLTPEQTRLPQTTATSSGQSLQRFPSPTAWLRVAQILLEQGLRETLAAGPPDGQSFRSLFMSQQDDELSQISRNSLSEQLDILQTIYKTLYKNKEYSDFFSEPDPTLVPPYSFETYDRMRHRILHEARVFIGRPLHIAARAYFHHPDIPLSWQRCRQTLDALNGADILLVEPHDPFPTGYHPPPPPGKRSLNLGHKRKRFFELKKRFAGVIPLLAAMDVIWCTHYLPSHNAEDRRRAGTYDIRPLRPRHSFMDDDRDRELTAATLAYTLWFQRWGLEQKLLPGKCPRFQSSDCPEATAISAPEFDPDSWLAQTTPFIRIRSGITGQIYKTHRAFYGQCATPPSFLEPERASESPFFLPLPSLPKSLVQEMARQESPESKPRKS